MLLLTGARHYSVETFKGGPVGNTRIGSRGNDISAACEDDLSILRVADRHIP